MIAVSAGIAAALVGCSTSGTRTPSQPPTSQTITTATAPAPAAVVLPPASAERAFCETLRQALRTTQPILATGLADEVIDFARELVSKGYGPYAAQLTKLAKAIRSRSLARITLAEPPVAKECAAVNVSLP